MIIVKTKYGQKKCESVYEAYTLVEWVEGNNVKCQCFYNEKEINISNVPFFSDFEKLNSYLKNKYER